MSACLAATARRHPGLRVGFRRSRLRRRRRRVATAAPRVRRAEDDDDESSQAIRSQCTRGDGPLNTCRRSGSLLRGGRATRGVTLRICAFGRRRRKG